MNLTTLLEEYTLEELFEILNVDKKEAVEALVEIGLIDLERFEQYFNETEDD